MMQARSEVEQLDVQHMGNPSQGVPIARAAGDKCPVDVHPLQSTEDMRVVGYVLCVIKADKLVVKQRPINRQCDGAQEHRYQNRAPHGVATVHQGWTIFPKRGLTSTRKPSAERSSESAATALFRSQTC